MEKKTVNTIEDGPQTEAQITIPEEEKTRLSEFDIDFEALGTPQEIIHGAISLTIPHIRQSEQSGRNIPLQNMVSWPNEKAILQMIQTAKELTDQNKEEPTPFPAYSNLISNQAWELFTSTLLGNQRTRLSQEVEIDYVTQEITKIIKLENFYRDLKPFGNLVWEKSPAELREMVKDDSLLCITENPELFTQGENRESRREIYNFERGLIIAFSIQGSPQKGKFSFLPNASTKPDPQAFRQAALWVLGEHLHLKGKPQHLADAIATYEGLHKRRKEVSLDLKILPYSEIEAEIEITPPTGDPNLPEYPWNLCWKIKPNTDIEVRELAETWLDTYRKNSEMVLHQYRFQMLKRLLSTIAKTNLLKTYEAGASVRESWFANLSIITPILAYLEQRVPYNNPLLFTTIYIEEVWKKLAPLCRS